jgi:CRP-like cAMP-binding protein
MAMIDSETRSATATAMTDCELLQVDRPLFEAIIRAEPTFAIHVMRAMVKRMRRMQLTMQS